MKSKQPVNLDLMKFKFPLPAITSILHRVSGVLLFLFTPVFLYMLSVSLKSEQGFNCLHQLILHATWMKLMMWVMLSSLMYHIVAGLRHLIMDLGFGETPCVAKASAVLMLLVFVVLAILVGVWLW